MSNLVSLQAKIAELQQQADQIKSREFSSTISEILEKMKAFGITLADLKSAQQKTQKSSRGRLKGEKATKVAKGSKRSSKLAGVKVEPKYRGPNGETWTGRGVMPKWLSQAIEAGQSKESFLISKA